MPQFRSSPSYDLYDDAEEYAMEEQSLPVVSRIPAFPTVSTNPTHSPSPTFERAASVSANSGPNRTGPLLVMNGQQPVITTEQLAAITAQTGPLDLETTSAPSLIAALQSSIPSSTTGRLTVIPAERKRSSVHRRAQKHHMSLHLRQSIVITTILTVFILTLISLAPLDNGQSTFYFFSGVGNWVQNGQFAWFLQSHMQPQQTTQTGSKKAPVPPAMVLPASQYVAIAQQDAINAGIPPTYFVRQINQESGFNPNAVSPAGAIGIAQFIPSTAAGLGIDPRDPIQSLRAAANLMAGYNRQYGGNYAMALAAYNGGPGTVQNATRTCGANWLNCLPGETRNYIYTIMGI